VAGVPEYELVLNAHPELGEGPVWDADRGVLWWVDILGGAVHRFDPAAGSDRAFDLGQPVGALTIRRNRRLILFARDTIFDFDPDTFGLHRLLDFEPEMPPRRCNDARADPSGRVWFGRLALDQTQGMGSLRTLAADMTATVALDGLSIPNGLDWSPDGRTMYFVDSRTRLVRAFDFDVETGSISRGRDFFRVGADPGVTAGAVPDGLTVDEEGCVWLAVWGGGCVLRIDPDGRLRARIDLPVSQVSSCAFGGPDLEDLYVTSAREGYTDADLARDPLAGALFRVRPGVRGLTARRSF
jgi:sugar lactone lactonase YvrE